MRRCAARTSLREPTRNDYAMSYRDTEHLRVLIANERKDRLALVAPIVAALGRELTRREIEGEDAGAVPAREPPEVALVGLGPSSDHALARRSRSPGDLLR